MSRIRLHLVPTVVLTAVAAASLVLAQDVRLRPVSAIYVDAKGSAINVPEGVAYDGRSLVVVADTGNARLLLYTVAGKDTVPTSELRLGQIPYPVHVRIDSRGEMLVLDGKSHRIARINPAGEFKGFVEIPQGARDVTIKSFEIDSRDNLYVLDVSGARIVVLGADGGVQREIAFASQTGFLSDLTVNSSGVVFAVDSVGKRVFVARKDDSALAPLTETLSEEMVFPTGIAADASGHLFVADQYDGGIVVLSQDGSVLGRATSMGWKEGFLRYPSGLSWANGLLFVADRGNNRIQGFAVLQ